MAISTRRYRGTLRQVEVYGNNPRLSHEKIRARTKEAHARGPGPMTCSTCEFYVNGACRNLESVAERPLQAFFVVNAGKAKTLPTDTCSNWSAK